MSWTDILTATTGTAGVTGGGILLALKRARTNLEATIENIAHTAAVEANKPLVEKVEKAVNDIDSLNLQLATQFGGNGGGMRQAINDLRVDVAKVQGIIAAATVIHPTPYPKA